MLSRATLSACMFAAASAFAQTAGSPASPAFDVASIRPSKPDAPQHTNIPLDSGNVYSALGADDTRNASGGYLRATHQPLWRYITFAYNLSGTQELSLRFNMFSGAPKSGAPFWVTGSFNAAPEYFDITARAPVDSSIDQMRKMMQVLLADRFRLATHFILADAPVFALVLAKAGVAGPELRAHPASDGCAAPSTDISDLPPICGVIAHVASSTPGQHYGGRAVPLSLFATSIPTMTGLAVMPRPVVDRTGLAGLFDFSLSWMHDPTADDGVVVDNAANFRDSLKAQMGLELKPSHAAISFLMIDHVERPSEN